MTEERVKELAQIWQDKWMEETSGTLHVGTMFICSLIHAVAAESRKEGIEEGMKRNRETVDETDYPPTLRR